MDKKELIKLLNKAISAVPKSQKEDYLYFALSDRYTGFHYHLAETFPNYTFQYFNDDIMDGKISLGKYIVYWDADDWEFVSVIPRNI